MSPRWHGWRLRAAMPDFQIVVGLVTIVAALVALSRRLGVSYPILLVLGGLALGFIPWLPDVEMKPNVVLALFLPPLLYSDAWRTSWRDFRANLRPIGLLAIGLVVITSAAVAAVAHALVPGLPWGAAFVLGAIVAPTDAVAPGQIAQRLGLPARLVTIVEGESLVNDASALVLFSLALGAVTTGKFSAWHGLGQFAAVSAGGIFLGLAVAWLMGKIFNRLEDPPVENTLSLLVPFVAYMNAEALHVSGVLAAVAAGLYLGQRSAGFQSARTRLQAQGFWSMLTFLLNGLLFILVGLQLHIIVLRLAHRHFGTLIVDALWVSLTVIAARIVWVFPATFLPRIVSRGIRKREPAPSRRATAVLSWMGLRGGISLAAALAIPFALPNGRPFPERDLLIFITFGVILATLVGQGLTLPWLIRRLHVEEDGIADREETMARLKAAQAASTRLEALASEPWVPDSLAAFLKTFYAERAERYSARAGDTRDQDREERADAYRRLRRELVSSEQDAVIALRDQGAISDAVLTRVQRDLDLETLHLEEDNSLGGKESD